MTNSSHPDSARAALARAERTSAGTGSPQNGIRLLCRRAIASYRLRSAPAAGRAPSGTSRARTRGSCGYGRMPTAAGLPATASASRRLNRAAPQPTRTPQSRAATARIRSRSAEISMPPSRRRNRHGWLLWSEGARIAASTAARRSSVVYPAFIGVLPSSSCDVSASSAVRPRCPRPVPRESAACAAGRHDRGPHAPAAEPGRDGRVRRGRRPQAAASRVAVTSIAPLSGTTETPSSVAVSQAADNASPARSHESGSSLLRRTARRRRRPGRDLGPDRQRARCAEVTARDGRALRLRRQHRRGQAGALRCGAARPVSASRR